MIVQCTSLLSPWWLGRTDTPAARAVHAAGFAAQLPVQIPILARLMAAVRCAGGEDAPVVVNPSHPDLTRPFLAPTDWPLSSGWGTPP